MSGRSIEENKGKEEEKTSNAGIKNDKKRLVDWQAIYDGIGRLIADSNNESKKGENNDITTEGLQYKPKDSEEKIQMLKNENKDLQKTILQLTEESNRVNAEIERLNKENQALREEIKSFKLEKEKQVKEIKENGDRESERQVQGQEHEKLMTQTNYLQNKNQTQNTKIVQQNEEVEKANAKIETLERENQKLEQKINTLNQQLNEEKAKANEKIESLEKEKQALSEKKEKLQPKNGDETNSKEIHEKEKQSDNQENASLRQDKSKLIEESNNLKSQIRNLTQQNEMLRQENIKQSKEVEILKMNNTQLEKNYEEKKKYLTDEINKLKKTIDDGNMLHSCCVTAVTKGDNRATDFRMNYISEFIQKIPWTNSSIKDICDQVSYDTDRIEVKNKLVRDDGARLIGHLISFSTSITILSLINTDIGPDGGEELGNALKANKALKKINLGSYDEVPYVTLWNKWNHIEDKGARAFRDALQVNEVLEELYISYQKISPTCITALFLIFAKTYSKPNKTMKLMDVTYNGDISEKQLENLREDLTVHYGTKKLSTKK